MMEAVVGIMAAKSRKNTFPQQRAGKGRGDDLLELSSMYASDSLRRRIYIYPLKVTKRKEKNTVSANLAFKWYMHGEEEGAGHWC
jgi:hypothetical protein